MKQQERNESRHLSFRFIVNFRAPFVTFNNGFVLRWRRRRRGSPLSAQFPDEPKMARKRIHPSFSYLISLFSQAGSPGGGRESLLALCGWKWKQRHVCMRVLSFFSPRSLFLYPPLIQGHGHHTLKTLNRRGSDSRGSAVLRQDMVMRTKWVSYARRVALETDPFLWKGCWNIR